MKKTTNTPCDFNRRSVHGTLMAAALFGALCVTAPQAVLAQAFPAKPVRMIVPFGPGTATDVFARQFSAGMSKDLGQSVVMEYKAGAGGVIGAVAAATSAPDGYTMLLASSASHGSNPSLYKKLGYDPVADFAPIARVVFYPSVLAVRKALPVKTVADLVAYAKANPGKLNFASTGPGSQGHMQASMLASVANIKVIHVPFKEAGQIYTAFERGDVDFMFYTFAALQPVIQSGAVHPIAGTGEKRIESTPSTPTMAEAGFPEVTMSAWSALYAPAGTPARMVERLNQAALRTLGDPDMQKKLASLDIIVAPSTPQELLAFTKSEVERYRKIAAMAGLQPE